MHRGRRLPMSSERHTALFSLFAEPLPRLILFWRGALCPFRPSSSRLDILWSPPITGAHSHGPCGPKMIGAVAMRFSHTLLLDGRIAQTFPSAARQRTLPERVDRKVPRGSLVGRVRCGLIAAASP